MWWKATLINTILCILLTQCNDAKKLFSVILRFMRLPNIILASRNNMVYDVFWNLESHKVVKIISNGKQSNISTDKIIIHRTNIFKENWLHSWNPSGLVPSATFSLWLWVLLGSAVTQWRELRSSRQTSWRGHSRVSCPPVFIFWHLNIADVLHVFSANSYILDFF